MKLKHSIISSILGLSAFGANAAVVDVEITNLTGGNYITPMAVVGHPSSVQLFNVGQAASPQIAEMAEGGSLAGLVALAGELNVPAEAAIPEGADMPMPLAPGMSASVTDFDTGANGDSLSIVGMILPTNDGFVGLNTWIIPSEPGTYMVYLNGYDAGTEANNELFSEMGGPTGNLGMPPTQGLTGGGSGGTGVMDNQANGTVHIHPGVLGDDNPTGGASDLDNTVHRWLNPVARAIITVK